MVRPEGFEPPTTVPKTGMISISLRAQLFHTNPIMFFIKTQYYEKENIIATIIS